MDKKTKFSMILLAVVLVLAAIISVVTMIKERRLDGMQIGNFLALALIGVVAAVVLWLNRKGDGDE